MDNTSIIDKLIEYMDNMDVASMEIDTLFEKASSYTGYLSVKYNVAKIVIEVSFVSNFFNMPSNSYYNERVLDNNIGSEENVYVVKTASKETGKCKASFYPIGDHKFTDEEKYSIRNISKGFYMLYTRAALMKYLKRIPYVDMLTGLYNTQGVLKYGYKYLDTENYAGIYLNIKDFRIINSTYGSGNGNILLQKFADKLRGLINPEKEFVARLGADKFFGFILKSNLDRFINIITYTKFTINYHEENIVVRIRPVMGVYYGNAGDKIHNFIENCSMAIDAGKAKKERLTYFDENIHQEAIRYKNVVNNFFEALNNGSVKPYYQPKVSAVTKQLCGCEALVRWIHEDEVVLPEEFVPVLEKEGAIKRLDLFILESVCSDIKSWIDKGIDPVRVSVNFSRENLKNDNIIDDTLNILRKYNVESKYLEIEITETSFYEDGNRLDEFVSAMHKHGIAVSMDDFGTGYSSLNLFKNLTFDVVKIDKSFVDDIDGKNNKSEIILDTVLNMLKALNIIVVAEGVQTEKQFNRLRAMGCDEIQGFIFDEPLAYLDFEKVLVKKNYN